MLLIHSAQHPTSPSLMPPIKLANSHNNSHHHRRNPSAPAAATLVSVHPTKTPGLLSLSKPQPTRQPPHHGTQSQNVRHSTPRQHKTKPAAANAKSEAKLEDKNQQQQHQQDKQQQDKQSQRGRGSPAKEKSARNASKSRAGHGGRARQPSPTPIPSLPQQEQASAAASPNDTDVFAKQQAPPSSASKATSTVLNNVTPAGRVASKRRNRPPIPFPTATNSTSTADATTVVPSTKAGNEKTNNAAKPVPVPSSRPLAKSATALPLSRSDSAVSHIQRKGLRRSETDVNAAGFPICDDNESDSEDQELDVEPVTPTRPSTRGGSRGPKGKTVSMAPKFNLSLKENTNTTWQQQRSVFVDFSDEGEQEQELSNGNGPRTAPLNGSFNLNPVPTTASNGNYGSNAINAARRAAFYAQSPSNSPSPLSRRNRGAHKRTPSFPADGLFSSNSGMSSSTNSKSASASDLSLPTSTQPHTQPIDLKALFSSAMASSSVSSFSSFGGSGGSSTPASKLGQQAKSTTTMTTPATVGPLMGRSKYANSNFQNSPSPEQLPPPSFMFGQAMLQ